MYQYDQCKVMTLSDCILLRMHLSYIYKRLSSLWTGIFLKTIL